MIITTRTSNSIRNEPYATVPAELKALPRWVVWRREKRAHQACKLPFEPLTGKLANSTDPSTWADFAVACAHTANYAGIGCMIDAPYVGVDLDHCRDAETGVTEAWALQILEDLNSYTELSPSGSGFHVWLRARVLPNGPCRAGRVEVYGRARYFTVTGQRILEASAEIEARDVASLQARLKELDPNYRPGSPPAAGSSVGIQPAASSALAAASSKFTLLMAGRWRDAGYKSQSEADLALCLLLAARHGCDTAIIDAEFRRSGLMREKWNRPDYSERTMQLATQRVRANHGRR